VLHWHAPFEPAPMRLLTGEDLYLPTLSALALAATAAAREMQCDERKLSDFYCFRCTLQPAS